MIISQHNRKSREFQQELYRLHYRRIYSTCLRIIGNRMDAEEAMHDVFMKLFNSIENLHSDKAFIAWSRSIAVRTAIDRVRTKTQISEQLNDNLTVADDEPDDSIELSVDAIRQAMNRLPDGYRIILSMRLFDECEFEEIASIMQISESTARSQYVRGRKKLAGMLKEISSNS